MKKTFIIGIIVIISLNFPFASSNVDVVLSLEPKDVTVPFIDDEREAFIVGIDLEIMNVEDLQQWKWTFSYDDSVIEFLIGSMGQNVYQTTGGWHGWFYGGHFGRYTYSGSDTFFTLYFKTKGFGSTVFTLTESELLDSSNNSIPHTISSCAINVVSFSEWVNGEFEELQTQYNILSVDYNSLNTNYLDLLASYSDLQLDYGLLEDNYHSLNNTYNELLSEFTNLEIEQMTLDSSLSNLQEQYTSQQIELDNLRKSHEELESQVSELQKRGIPGFPYSSIVLGTSLGLIILLRYSKRSRPSIHL